MPLFSSSVRSRANMDSSLDVESEFPFLESKPSRLSAMNRGGGSRAANKGRWHAGEAVMRRKLANQAFLIKIAGGGAGDQKERMSGGGKSGGGGGNGGAGGGLRRWGGRVLGPTSTMMEADRFAPSVPYSLNRKHRWAQDGADWLTELAGGWKGGERVRLSLSETDYSLSGTKSVRALHRLDTEKGRLPTRMAKSGRGALLADLAAKTEEELAEEEEQQAEDAQQENQVPVHEMHFELSKPHSVTKVFAGKFFKRKHNSIRSAKRCTTETVTSSSSTLGTVPNGGAQSQQPQTSIKSSAVQSSCLTSSVCAITESETEEENGLLLAQYKPPRAETYSLADFVKDSSTPLVIVRRPGAHKNGNHTSIGAAINGNNNKMKQTAEMVMVEAEGGAGTTNTEPDDQQFAIVPEMECTPLPNAEEELLEAERQQCQLLAALRRELNAAGTEAAGGAGAVGFFGQFPLPPALNQLESPLAQMQAFVGEHKADWHTELLNDAGGDNFLFSVDLSCALAKEQQTNMLLLVLVFGPSRVWLNAVFPLEEQKVAQAIAGCTETAQFVPTLLNAVRRNFAEWQLRRQQPSIASSELEHLRSIFHSARLCVPLQPACVHSVLAQQRAEQAKEEGQFVGAEELLAPSQTEEQNEAAEVGDDGGEDEEEQDEFELIDMNELLTGAAQSQSSKQCEQEKTEMPPTKCAHCSSNVGADNDMPMAQLRSCGHHLCRNCLLESIGPQIANQEARLHCPACTAQLPMDLLPWLFPLPFVNMLVLLQHAETCLQHGHHLARCPGCHGLLDIVGDDGGMEEQRQLFAHFGQLVCTRCQLHWCSNCAAVPHWPLSCAQWAEWARRSEQGQQPIGGQFAEIASEAHSRRFDSRLGWQLGKHMRRLGDARVERRFGLTRRTALHLLEFGTIWLYLNRQQRPLAWAQLKTQLWALHDRVECMDNELLFSGSLTNPQTLKCQLTSLEQLTENCIQKFLNAFKA